MARLQLWFDYDSGLWVFMGHYGSCLWFIMALPMAPLGCIMAAIMGPYGRPMGLYGHTHKNRMYTGPVEFSSQAGANATCGNAPAEGRSTAVGPMVASSIAPAF